MPRWILGSTLLTLLMACEPSDEPSPEPAAPLDSATTAPSASAEPAETSSTAETTASAALETTASAEPEASAEPASATTKAGATPPEGQSAPQPSASAAASADAKVVEGAKTSEPEYSVWLQSAGQAVAGTPSRLQAVLVAKGEWKCNENYPIKMKLGPPPPGVSYPSPIATGASVTKKRASLAVPFLASSPGDKAIQGVFHFSVCNASSCVMKKKPLQISVHVDAGS